MNKGEPLPGQTPQEVPVHGTVNGGIYPLTADGGCVVAAAAPLVSTGPILLALPFALWLHISTRRRPRA